MDDIPLYKRIMNTIIREIQEKELAPGARLPSETDLVKRFSVSRATIVKTMYELEKLGFVERRQGRGTFVAREKLNYTLPKLTGFSEDVISSNGIPRSTVVEHSLGSDFEQSKYFSNEDRDLQYILRLRFSGDQPIGLNYAYIPLTISRFIGFTPEAIMADPSISLYKALEEAGYSLGYADQVFEARSATGKQAKLLQLKPTAPVMYYERKTYTDEGRLIEYMEGVISGSAYRYSIRLYREGVGDIDNAPFPNLKTKGVK